MKKQKLWVYIVIGVICAAVFLVAWELLYLLIGKVQTFGDGMKDIIHWIFAVVFGAGTASTIWKKDKQKEEK